MGKSYRGEEGRVERPPHSRQDRTERLRTARRDLRRIERADAYTSRREGQPDWRPGSTVRAVA